MLRRVMWVLTIMALSSAPAVVWAQAEPAPPGPPAVLQLRLPDDATATVDDVELGLERIVTLTDLKVGEIRRVKVVVKFPNGAEEERLVEVAPGQRIPVLVPRPGVETPTTVATQVLTPMGAAALSVDNRYIVVGLETKVAVLWDTADGRPIRSFIGHEQGILSIAFNPDASQILTGSADGKAILWETATGLALRTFAAHTAPITSVAFSPDGTRILTGSADKTAIVWNAATAEKINTFKGHTKEVMGVAYSPNGSMVATASLDNTAALWDVETGKQLFLLRGHRDSVSSVRFSPDGAMVGTGSYDNGGIFWDTTTGKQIRGTASRHVTDIYSVAFTPDGRWFITGDREEVIMMWEVATGKKLRTFAGHVADVNAAVVSVDGRMLLTCSRDGTAKLWDLATGLELVSLTTDATRRNWAVVAPNGFFDASEPGRRLLGFRSTKLPGAEVDQYFAECYRPGLLAEVIRGESPLAQTAFARSVPPLLKIVSPKGRLSSTQEATIAVDVIDQGGGVLPPVLYDNGARVAAAVDHQPAAEGRPARSTFRVPLSPGPNRLRIKAASGDGSWESIDAEMELTWPRAPGQKDRLYVLAVDAGSSSAEPGNSADGVQALTELFRRRSATFHDRVDVVPLYGRNATKRAIEDSLSDIAELTRPQDTLVVLVSCEGAIVDGRLYLAPHDLPGGNGPWETRLRTGGVSLDELAESMAAAPALKRVLIVDSKRSAAAALDERSPFALRGSIERMARRHGIHIIAATRSSARQMALGRSPLAYALLAAVNAVSDGPLASKSIERGDSGNEIDVMEWFEFAAREARSLGESTSGTVQEVEHSTQARGFPLFALEKLEK